MAYGGSEVILHTVTPHTSCLTAIPVSLPPVSSRGQKEQNWTNANVTGLGECPGRGGR
jgi:hypothetical protein